MSNRKLPDCVKCGNKDFIDGSVTLGYGETRYYVCHTCKTEVMFRYCGPPGVLVWVVMPELQLLRDMATHFLQQVSGIHRINSQQIDKQVDPDRETTKRLISQLSMVNMPPVPAGLQVHVLRGDNWVKL